MITFPGSHGAILSGKEIVYIHDNCMRSMTNRSEKPEYSL